MLPVEKISLGTVGNKLEDAKVDLKVPLLQVREDIGLARRMALGWRETGGIERYLGDKRNFGWLIDWTRGKVSRMTLSCSFAFCDRPWCRFTEIENAGTRFWVKGHVFVFRLVGFEEPLGYLSRQSDIWVGSSKAELGLAL